MHKTEWGVATDVLVQTVKTTEEFLNPRIAEKSERIEERITNFLGGAFKAKTIDYALSIIHAIDEEKVDRHDVES